MYCVRLFEKEKEKKKKGYRRERRKMRINGDCVINLLYEPIHPDAY